MAKKPGPTTARPAVPPEERFWQRYSPHHEFSVSASSSLLIHGLIVAAVLAVGYLALRLGLHDSYRALAVDPVAIAGEGGAGAPAAGDDRAARAEDVTGVAGAPPARAEPHEALNPVEPDPLPPPSLRDTGSRPSREESAAVFQRLLDKATFRRRAADGTGPPGDGKPAGVPRVSSIQVERLGRWKLTFSTANGDDYRRQLFALGAILAVPERDNRFLVVRDLAAVPAAGRVEDLGTFDRIFWVDDRPDSVRALARALRLRGTPSYFIAFFPKELEDELLRKELAFRNRAETDVKATHFAVVKRGRSYEPVVTAQR